MLTREDFAKYPFTKEGAEYVLARGINVEELANPDYTKILDRAEHRVDEALTEGTITTSDLKEVEIFSFPVAILLVAQIDDGFLTKRYALSEAKRAYEILKNEADDKLIAIARTTFNWKVRAEHNRFFLNLVDFLRNSTQFHDDSWKLVNRIVIKGDVFLRKEECARLLQEEIRRRVETTIENSPKVELDAALGRKVERLRQIVTQRKGAVQIEELPKSAITTAYPPCIKRLYDALIAGEHLSHMGRFALTSFLLNVGIKPEDLAKLYASVSDFDEKLTRYQVEHIAGEKGSRTRYRPPSCSTLKTHSLCLDPDTLCSRIRHPLQYYILKARRNI